MIHEFGGNIILIFNLESFHNKAQGGELAAAVADQLVPQAAGKHLGENKDIYVDILQAVGKHLGENKHM